MAGVRTRKALGFVAAGFLVAGAGLVIGGMSSGALMAAAAPITVGPVNPVRVPVSGHPANSDFTIFVEGDVALNADEAEGTVAAGGNLSFSTGYNIAAGSAFPPTFIAPGDAQPTYLYVRGGVDFSAGPTSVLRVLNGGFTKIGDPSTYTAFDRDQNNAVVAYNIVPPGAAYGAVPRIEGTVTQTPAQVAAPVGTDLIDIDGAFATYRSLTAQLGQCPATVVLTDDAGNPVTSPLAPGSRAHVSLTPGQTNVLELSAADLAALGELTFDTLPDPSTPLLVNVTGTSFLGSVPNLAGASSAAAPFILWNFPTATTVTVTGGDSIEGTLYAPNADLNWQVTQNIEGNVIAAGFIHGAPGVGGTLPREVHSFPFAAELTCTFDDQVEPTPTPTPTLTPTPTPTVTPTPTPTPTGGGGGGGSPEHPGMTGTLAASGSDQAGTGATLFGLGVALLAAGALTFVLQRRSGRPAGR